jgi:hypothetical protein
VFSAGTPTENQKQGGFNESTLKFMENEEYQVDAPEGYKNAV